MPRRQPSPPSLAPLPHYGGQPSALIATIVVALGRQLQLPPAEIDRLRVAALLHDVGKVGIPGEILEKPAALTSAEWRSVVQHPRIGQVILEQAAALKDAVPIILHHHERYGGHGYPYGLRATEIPLGARIVAIADAYDAMTHDRPYKLAMSHPEAIAELRRHAGTQFDPELVELFCDLYGSAAPEVDDVVGSVPLDPLRLVGGSGHTHPHPVPRPQVARSASTTTASATSAPRPERRRRKTDRPAQVDPPSASVSGTPGSAGSAATSQTMPPDGALGIVQADRSVRSVDSGPGTNGRSSTGSAAG